MGKHLSRSSGGAGGGGGGRGRLRSLNTKHTLRKDAQQDWAHMQSESLSIMSIKEITEESSSSSISEVTNTEVRGYRGTQEAPAGGYMSQDTHAHLHAVAAVLEEEAAEAVVTEQVEETAASQRQEAAVTAGSGRTDDARKRALALTALEGHSESIEIIDLA